MSNLATSITYGSTTLNYTFDANGNQITEGSSRSFEWDYGDRMRGFSEGTTNATYLYDSGGNRIKKVVKKSSSLKEVTVYIDGGFEYLYTLDGTNTVGDEMNEIHVMDDRSRIAKVTVEYGITDVIKYNLEDHLGNSSFTVDDAGSLITREEYFPFGETSFGSFAKKRYRYNGKERDEESGLYYYGARYYAAWTCRFISIDPLAGQMPFSSPYSYAANNPVVLVDVDGLAPGGGGLKGAGKAATNNREKADTGGNIAQADVEGRIAPSESTSQPNSANISSVPTSHVSTQNVGTWNKRMRDSVNKKSKENSDFFRNQGLPPLSESSDGQSGTYISAESRTDAQLDDHRKKAMAQLNYEKNLEWYQNTSPVVFGERGGPIHPNFETLQYIAVDVLAGGVTGGIGKAYNAAKAGLAFDEAAVGGVELARFSGAAKMASSSGSSIALGAEGRMILSTDLYKPIPITGFADVVVHGSPTGLYRLHEGVMLEVSIGEITNQLTKAGLSNTPIRLVACSAGAIENGIAQQLANATGQLVIAPTEKIFLWPSGRWSINNVAHMPSWRPSTGRFRGFIPK